MAEIVLSEDEYPALAGLKVGDPVAAVKAVEAKVLAVADGQVTLDLGQLEIEAEGPADKELRKLRGEPSVAADVDDEGEEVD